MVYLLHLVGILFPHIIDDARSKPHQTVILYSDVYVILEISGIIFSFDIWSFESSFAENSSLWDISPCSLVNSYWHFLES
jgi:hypothetical protein